MARLLTEKEVESLLTMPDCIAALDDAFRHQAAGQVVNHARQRIYVPDGTFHLMQAADLTAHRLVVKAYASFRPKTRFLNLLYDTRTGDLLAILEADHLGRVRTGAATGVAARYMAREDADTLGLFGAGWQAETQAQAIAAVRPLKRILVYSRTPEKRDAFARRLAADLQIMVMPVKSPEEALRAGIVVTATTSRQPVFDGANLLPGTLVCAVGANMLVRAEVDIETIARAACVVVDSVEQAQREAGDLLPAVEMRRFRWEQAVELKDVVSGRVAGRRDADDITLFKSNGIALEDVAAASLVYERAVAQGVGRDVAFWA